MNFKDGKRIFGYDNGSFIMIRILFIISLMFISSCYKMPNIDCMTYDEYYSISFYRQSLLHLLRNYLVFALPFIFISIYYTLKYLTNESINKNSVLYTFYWISLIPIIVILLGESLVFLGIIGNSIPLYIYLLTLIICFLIIHIYDLEFDGQKTMIRTSLHTIVYGVGSIMTWLFIAKTIMNWSNKIPIEAIYYNYDNRLAEQYSNNAYFNDQVNYISPENCWVYFYKESPQILKYQLIIRELDAIPLSKESIKVLLLDVEGKSIGNFDISMNEKSWNWDCNYFEGTTDKISKYAIDNVSNIFVLIESQFPWLREI